MTLVLVHGSAGTAALWDKVREHLYGIPLFVPNLPGRAGVGWPDDIAGRDVADYAAWLMRMIDAEGIERPVLAGHSLGGAMALWCALEYPDRVAGIVLGSSGARLRVLPAVLDGLQDGLRGVLDLIVQAQFGREASDRDLVAWRRMVESCGWHAALADLTACDRFDVMERLAEVRCPVQILAGADDRTTPLKYATYLAERIRVSRLTVYQGAGHALPVEKPAEVAGELAVLWAATAPRNRTVIPERGAKTVPDGLRLASQKAPGTPAYRPATR